MYNEQSFQHDYGFGLRHYQYHKYTIYLSDDQKVEYVIADEQLTKVNWNNYNLIVNVMFVLLNGIMLLQNILVVVVVIDVYILLFRIDIILLKQGN